MAKPQRGPGPRAALRLPPRRRARPHPRDAARRRRPARSGGGAGVPAGGSPPSGGPGARIADLRCERAGGAPLWPLAVALLGVARDLLARDRRPALRHALPTARADAARPRRVVLRRSHGLRPGARGSHGLGRRATGERPHPRALLRRGDLRLRRLPRQPPDDLASHAALPPDAAAPGAPARAPARRDAVSAPAAWYTERERGSTLGMRITVWLYRWLGYRVAQLVVFAIVAYFFATDAAGRRASRRYLARLYATPGGAAALGGAPSARKVFRHFMAFGLSILDRIGFWLGDPAGFAVAVRGMEHLDRVARDGRGALVLGSHLGSFDAMRLLAEKRSPLRVNVLTYTRNAARINGILRRLGGAGPAGREGVRAIPVQPDGFQHLVEAKACLERGEVVAILADRVPPGETRSIARVSFLGGAARLPEGPFRLAALLRCPVLLMSGLRSGERRYEIRVEPFAERVELPRSGRRAASAALCQRFADWLAAGCLRAPYQWFNFYPFFVDDEPGAGR